ncbi:hypothetical protein [Flavobacterium rhizosphaerae]|uniref:Uncharacterized protein n=1 Tax=Flavobacterium rhizosphaerae TaxID=3163298 RepID=A0ABW8Z114_9FLAO
MAYKRKSRLESQKSLVQRFLFVLGLVFFMLYLVLGLMIIFWNVIPLGLSKNQRLALGILLIVYSFFRFVRLIQSRNKSTEE